jgi:hypothetical protein
LFISIDIDILPAEGYFAFNAYSWSLFFYITGNVGLGGWILGYIRASFERMRRFFNYTTIFNP